MPIPTGFPQVNAILGKPPGWTDDQCGSLSAFTDGHRWVSKWCFSEVELRKLEETGFLWLTVVGSAHPPVSMDVLSPLEPLPEQEAELQLNGERCPRCKSTGGIRRINFMWVEERLDWSGNPTGRDVGPSTTVCECAQCGYQVSINDTNPGREAKVLDAIRRITGETRDLNESMTAFQRRLIDKYGTMWPEMLQDIVSAVMSED